jgi:hypothetical protein
MVCPQICDDALQIDDLHSCQHSDLIQQSTSCNCLVSSVWISNCPVESVSSFQKSGTFIVALNSGASISSSKGPHYITKVFYCTSNSMLRGGSSNFGKETTALSRYTEAKIELK